MRTVEYAALEVPDVSNFLFGTVLTAAGVLTTAYFLGMSIVVDDETVSKRYLFGLIRVVIARKQFRAAVETEYGRGGSYQRIDFDSADEKEVMFSVYPRWVWRERDVDELYGIANQARNWRETHAQPSPPPRHHGIGTYLGSIWRMGYLLAFVFVIPVTFAYTKWGGAAGLVGVGMYVVVVLTLSAELTWGKGVTAGVNTISLKVIAAIGGVAFASLLFALIWIVIRANSQPKPLG